MKRVRADGGAAKDEEPLPDIAGRHEVDWGLGNGIDVKGK